MTRANAEQMIADHLAAIREIVLEYGMTSDTFSMYVSKDYASGWMFKNNGEKPLEYVLNVDRHFNKEG